MRCALVTCLATTVGLGMHAVGAPMLLGLTRVVGMFPRNASVLTSQVASAYGGPTADSGTQCLSSLLRLLQGQCSVLE